MKSIKILKIILYAFTVLLFTCVIILGIHIFGKFGTDIDKWLEYLRSFGVFSSFVLLAFQILQVFVAIIPGEVIEVAAGLLLPPLFACVVIYIGVFLASSLIFFLMRKMGSRFSRIFVSREKLRALRFINTKEKLKKSAFLLFLIPGTPKDLLTYFFALTPFKFSDFAIITMIARFPSVISSVVGGRYVGEGEYVKAIIVFAVTAAMSIIGILIYGKIKKKYDKRKINRFKRRTVFKRTLFSKKKFKKVKNYKFKRKKVARSVRIHNEA